MISQNPEITSGRHRHLGSVRGNVVIGVPQLPLQLRYQVLEFGVADAQQFQVEGLLLQCCQLQPQHFVVPTSM